MSDIQKRINERMDTLQLYMESNVHLQDPGRVEVQIATLSPYWAHMSDEDKDYVDCARWAIEKKMEWDV
jgi:hypothetical protein